MDFTRRDFLHRIPAGLATVAAAGKGWGAETRPARESLFLYYDRDDRALMPASDIEKSKLIPSGGVRVNIQLSRIRFGRGDLAALKKYGWGAVYLDVGPPLAGGEESSKQASLLFAAFPVAPQNIASANTPDVSRGVAVQRPSEVTSLELPAGRGKLALAVFAKDRNKTDFGAYLDSHMPPKGSAASPFIFLLNKDAVGLRELLETRVMVGNLQLKDAKGSTILQAPPTEIACTAEAWESTSLPIVTGSYLVVAKEQAPEIAPQLGNLKVMNGFLVAKEAGALDFYAEALNVLPSVTYLSFQVQVTPLKKE